MRQGFPTGRCAVFLLDPQILEGFGEKAREHAGRKEVTYMIQSVTNIDTVIDGVEEITVEEIGKWVDSPQRVIIVRTKHNENYYLKLQADQRIKLRLLRETADQQDDWLIPKVYHGQSMDEQELEEKEQS
jgi:hypothetical protein